MIVAGPVRAGEIPCAGQLVEDAALQGDEVGLELHVRIARARDVDVVGLDDAPRRRRQQVHGVTEEGGLDEVVGDEHHGAVGQNRVAYR